MVILTKRKNYHVEYNQDQFPRRARRYPRR